MSGGAVLAEDAHALLAVLDGQVEEPRLLVQHGGQSLGGDVVRVQLQGASEGGRGLDVPQHQRVGKAGLQGAADDPRVSDHRRERPFARLVDQPVIDLP